MVNASDILNLISDKNQLGLEDANQLSPAIKRMPWFSTLHVLQAKAHHNVNSTLFSGLLRKAAIYTGDRNLLYDIIHEQAEEGIAIEQEITNTANKEDISELATAENMPAILPVDEVKTTPQTPEVENAIEPEVQVDEVENMPVIETVKPEEILASAEIDEELDTASTNEETDEDLPEVDLNKDLETRIKVIYDPVKELAKLTAEEVKDTSEKLEVQPVIIAYNPETELAKYMQSTEVEESSAHDFTFWLDHFNDEQEAEKPIQKPRILHEDDDPSTLLEKFIHNRPSISRPKAEFFNAENMAKKSEELKLDMVSESLAKLFIKQGMPDKAIEIYEKLMLQNPSNNTFFAAQIEKIKHQK